MISREEIAKNLREAGERLDKEAPSNLTAAAYTTLFELLESAGIREGNSYSDVFSRLADLIDLTCHMRETVEDERTVYVCSNCGSWKSEDKKILSLFNYCPVCGARVVRE
jgi:DNA-directed RNA polymerase subunit RPC12/RpoP